MSAAQDRRIEELEAELVRANVQLKYLQTELASCPAQSAELAQRDERIASLESRLAQYVGTSRQMVREVAPASIFFMPTIAQFSSLLRVVYVAYPKFVPKDGHEQALREQTYAAFSYLATVSRTGLGAFSKYSNDTWTDRCAEWCRDRGLARDMCMSAFTVALLMHGDIAHTLDVNQWPYDFHVGIEESGGRLPKGDGWQRVLQTNHVLAPQRVHGRARPPLPPTTTIRGGNQYVGLAPRVDGW